MSFVSCVRLPAPQAGEEVGLRLPSGCALSCRVWFYREFLVLRHPWVPGLAPGDRVVLRRVRNGQTYLFGEKVVKQSPLTVTCSCPTVVREPRTRAVLSVLYGPPGGPRRKTRVVDVSMGGMCFHAWPPAPEEGCELDLEFDLYPCGSIRARAAVAQVYRWSPAWPEVGVAFLEMLPEATETLSSWLSLQRGVEVVSSTPWLKPGACGSILAGRGLRDAR
ncbi:MAG: PilZ domain-containing protein [Bacillota bacterium]